MRSVNEGSRCTSDYGIEGLLRKPRKRRSLQRYCKVAPRMLHILSEDTLAEDTDTVLDVGVHGVEILVSAGHLQTVHNSTAVLSRLVVR